MATEIIEMEARLKNYISGEVNKIESDIKRLGDTASDSFGKGSSAGKTFNDTFKGILAGGIVLKGLEKGFNFLSSSVSDGIDEMRQFTIVQTRLNTALGYTSIALEEQATQLTKLTAYSDDQIVSAQAQLANLIKEENTIKRLMPLVLDFATAKGMDLATASDLVAKTIGSETNALGRHGVQVEGAVGSTQRLESAMRGLSDAFRGQAEAFAQTDFGKLQQMQNAVNDLKEGIANSLLPVMTEFISVVSGLGNDAQATGRAIGNYLTLPFDLASTAAITLMQGFNALRISFKETQRDFAYLGGGKNLVASLNSEIEGLKKFSSELDQQVVDIQKRRLGILESKDLAPKAKTGGRSTAGGGTTTSVQATQETSQKVLRDISDMSMKVAGLLQEAETKKIELFRSISEEYLTLQKESLQRDLDLLAVKQGRETAIYAQGSAERSAIEALYDQKRVKTRAEWEARDKAKAKESRDAKISYYGDIASSFGDTMAMVAKASGANAKQQKAIAIGQAAINTAVSATKTASSVPYPFNIPLVALAIIQGAAQMAIISQQKFAMGGIVGGVSYSGDNVNARLNSGEMVLNREQQANLFKMANGNSTTNNAMNLSINVAQGGTYDMAAAQYTVEQLKPIIGKALVGAHKEGYLNDFYAVR